VLPLAAVTWAVLPGCLQRVDASCGGLELACCSDSRCESGLECGSDARCHACGGDGQPCCGGTSCADGLECGLEGLCRLCGSDGQPCCAGGLCASGAECRAARCERCGAPGEGCCAGASCDEGARCENGGCVAKCGAGCEPGAQRCASGSIELCGYATPPCTRWTQVVERCPTGQVCQEGKCVERCPDACPLGSHLCTSEGLKTCVLHPTTQCPVYQLAPDAPDKPSCMTGACDEGFCWEGPLPQGNGLRIVAGASPTHLHALDELGNILNFVEGHWTYEWRVPSGGAVRGLSSCRLPGQALAVGERGLVLRRNWTGWLREDLGTTAVNLHAVACGASNMALALGANGSLWARTPDGKESGTWRALTSPTTEELHGVHVFARGVEGWAVGASGHVVRCQHLDAPALTTCALEPQPLTTADLNAVWVNEGDELGTGPRAGEVVIVGDEGLVLQRAPGASWAIAAQGLTSQSLNAVWGLDMGSVYAVGDGGAFLRRIEERGVSESFSGVSLKSVYASDTSHLFVVGDAGEMWFSDVQGLSGPGTRWLQTGGKQPTREVLLDVDGSDASNVFAVGANGTVLHKYGDVWVPEARGLTASDLNAVTVVSSEETYAVGDDGVILARRDGTWAREGVGLTSEALYGVTHAGSTVYAVGVGGTWLEKPVGGASAEWQSVAQPLSGAIFLAMATNGTEVWAVGAECAAVRKSGGQFNVETIEGCTFEHLFALWVGADGEVFVGDMAQGLVLHRLAGKWQREALGSFEAISDFVVRGTDAWALCSSGLIYRRTAGLWKVEAKSLTTHGFEGGYVAPDGRLYVVGSGGLIWQRR